MYCIAECNNLANSLGAVVLQGDSDQLLLFDSVSGVHHVAPVEQIKGTKYKGKEIFGAGVYMDGRLIASITDNYMLRFTEMLSYERRVPMCFNKGVVPSDIKNYNYIKYISSKLSDIGDLAHTFVSVSTPDLFFEVDRFLPTYIMAQVLQHGVPCNGLVAVPMVNNTNISAEMCGDCLIYRIRDVEEMNLFLTKFRMAVTDNDIVTEALSYYKNYMFLHNGNLGNLMRLGNY